MKNFTLTDLGKIGEIKTNFENGKAFLHDALNLTGCEISINCMQGGLKLPFSHSHKQNEEIYIFLKGEGTMTLDGDTVEVKEGTCVKVSPAAARTMEAKTELHYICVQAKENSLEQFGLGDAALC